MVFDQANAPHLKPWLVRTLEPICDAEPGALADYILALLKHAAPEPEMRAELMRQLEEFLENECAGFIDTLFTALRTKSYLPYTATPSSPSSATKPDDGGIPIPIDVLLPHSQGDRGRKRSNSNDEADGRPSKGARLSHDSQYSRYGNGGQQGWGRPGQQQMMMPGFGMPMGMGMNGMGQMGGGRRQQGYQPPDQKRGICRDYHNNGYCARGAMCKYSHGDDAVVPGQMYPMNMQAMGMPFMPMFPGNGMPFMPGAAYDPHEARMDMRPVSNRPPRAPLLPRTQQADGTTINTSGELPVIQDLTPVIPRDASDPQSQQQPHQQPHQPTEQPLPDDDVDMRNPSMPPMDGMGGGYNPMMGMNMANGQSYPQPMQDIDGAMSGMPGMRPPTLGRGGYRGRGGGGRGRGGTFPDAQGFRPEKRNDKTLVVEKIPEDKLTLEQVNDWFKRFGTVTNVAIDAMTAKALVSFASHQEAHAAWKAEEAVFGNRFVKVFWHRPMEGHGQVGARMLAASAPLMANMGTGKPEAPNQPPSGMSSSTSAGPSGTTTPRKQSATPGTSATMSALAAKQKRLEETIAEQKSLMAALDSASPEEKKEIMAKLRKLGEEQTKLTAAATEEAAVVKKATAAPTTNGLSEKERLEKERLDQELEFHGDPAQSGSQGESMEDLKAKLEKLKAEAASLGLDPASAPPYRGGYRGRARGAPRAYYRGGPIMRGGPPRSMKLDNRPKRLLVKGVPEESTQALKDWYETTGQLESVEPSGADQSYIVVFKSRSAAEQGLAKGSNIPIVGSVQISWYTGPAGNAPSSSAPKPAPAVSEMKTGGGEDTTMGGPTTGGDSGVVDYAAGSTTHEEEIVASGWGGGDGDEDGMGML